MNRIIRDRLEVLEARTDAERDNAIKEILQEVALYALWCDGFFDHALFHGGTSLRILHGLPRFSENLDFMLVSPNAAFDWQPYLNGLRETFTLFGLESEVRAKGQMDATIRKAVIKDNSIANQIDLAFVDRDPRRKVTIKLEIDTHPPEGTGTASTFLSFPADHEVRHQDLASNFALKMHALLCRPYLKGRDWFDFSWYVARTVSPNLGLLDNALRQAGPWASSAELDVDAAWLRNTMESKIRSVDWQDAAEDVRPFLMRKDLRSLDLWSDRFFLAKLEQLSIT